jgi:hypothetical protein
MSIHFCCESCESPLSAGNRQAGESIRCPGCGRLEVVPPGAGYRPPSRTRRFLQLLVGAGIGMALVLLAVAAAMHLAGRTANRRKATSAEKEPVYRSSSGMKLRQVTTENALEKQLVHVPEVNLDPGGRIQRWIKSGNGGHFGLAVRLRERQDLAGLPFLRGQACRLDAQTARGLAELVAQMREAVGAAERGLPPPDYLTFEYRNLLRILDAHRGPAAERVAALRQFLTGEGGHMRYFLIDRLAREKGKRVSVILARRALFDLHEAVREEAVAALKKRPAAEYRDTLLAGLRYPWAPVADHAAEALVALKLRQTVPHLVKLLGDKTAFGPFAKRVGGKRVWFTRELVRVNHLRNCLLCHASSRSEADPARGLVPTPGEPVPQNMRYCPTPGGTFVRADVTYLRQDFSVRQRVARPNQWPEVQRFDFLVQVRRLTRAGLADQRLRAALAPPGSDQRRAILFALRELTGKDFGPSAARWKQFLRARNRKR